MTLRCSTRTTPCTHRAHHRARARHDPPGHGGHLRRQPHDHLRRARRARLWHRHVRGRARAGDADARLPAGPRHAHPRGWTAARRDDGQGPHPDDHQPHRCTGCARLRRRVLRLDHRGTVWGTSPDQAIPITGTIPQAQGPQRPSLEHAMRYTGLDAFAKRHWTEQPWVRDVARRTKQRLDEAAQD